MPRITDKRIIAGKQRRNEQIRKKFAKLWDSGLRYDLVMDKLIDEFMLSKSTITQILKGYGHYKPQ